jgi:phosphoesterase RecJ-like protein
VTPIVQALGPIDTPTATCLMTALLTDTGSFRYASVTPRTLRIAAELVQAGASPADVYTRVYESRPAAAFRLLAMALSRLELTPDGRVAWTSVTQDMLRASGAPMEESEGIIGQLRAIAGVRVALLFKEEPDAIRVSIRARAGIRANIIAEAFGGGGHAAAAGFTAAGPLPDVMRRALEAVQHELAAGAVS